MVIFTGTSSVQTTGGDPSDEFCRYQFCSDYRWGPLLASKKRWFFTGTSSIQTTGGCCSCGACDESPSVVTSDQTIFYPGTSTSGLSSGVTVGDTGSSLVQTTGEAAQRVDLPDVAVTI